VGTHVTDQFAFLGEGDSPRTVPVPAIQCCAVERRDVGGNVMILKLFGGSESEGAYVVVISPATGQRADDGRALIPLSSRVDSAASCWWASKCICAALRQFAAVANLRDTVASGQCWIFQREVVVGAGQVKAGRCSQWVSSRKAHRLLARGTGAHP